MLLDESGVVFEIRDETGYAIERDRDQRGMVRGVLVDDIEHSGEYSGDHW